MLHSVLINKKSDKNPSKIFNQVESLLHRIKFSAIKEKEKPKHKKRNK